MDSIKKIQKSKKTEFQIMISKDDYNINCIENNCYDKKVIEILNVLVKLIKKHELLKSYFTLEDGELNCKIPPEINVLVKYCECKEEELDAVIDDFVVPFDLEKQPLFRLGIVKLDNSKYILLFDIHHIICDGLSLSILINDFIQIASKSTLDNSKYSYSDFSQWFYEQQSSGNLEQMKNYWLNHLPKEIPLLNLPLDYERPAVFKPVGSTVEALIPEEMMTEIKQFCIKNKITEFMFLFGVYVIFLNKYTGQNENIIGVPVYGRTQEAFRDIVGLLINFLPIYVNVDTNLSTNLFFNEIKKICIGAFQNQYYAFENIVSDLSVTRNSSRNVLFDTMFEYRNNYYNEVNINEVTYKPYEIRKNASKFDLTIFIERFENSCKVKLEYCSQLFTHQTVERFRDSFINIIKSVLNQQNASIKEISANSNDDISNMIFIGDNQLADIKPLLFAHKMVEAVAEKYPDKVAILQGQRTVTYSELNNVSNQIANWFLHNNVKKGSFIAVSMDNSIEMIMVILATMKVGGAFVLIDKSAPLDRALTILDETRADAFVVSKDEKYKNQNINNIVCFDNIIYQYENSDNLNLQQSVDDIAYSIFTSGTTGLPKGVLLSHKSFANYINWAKEYYLQSDQYYKMAFYTSVAFDLTLTSIFLPIVSGNCVVIYENYEKTDCIREVIRDDQVNIVKLTPSHLTLLNLEESSNKDSKIQKFIIGGENLRADLAYKLSRSFGGNVEIYNEYGPTETVVGSMIYKYNSRTQLSTSVPIGKAIYNTGVYILDEDYKPVPYGAIGQICISGTGVGIGYINMPEATSRVFVDDPFFSGKKMYLTGDYGRYLENYNIEYRGRKDQQVKINGFRIELEEIEKTLLRNENIKEAYITAQDVGGNGKQLVAYVILKEKDNDAEKYRQYLQKYISSYMIPNRFVFLDEFPLKTSGKMDVESLKVLSQQIENEEIVEPIEMNENELIIAEAFKKILNYDSIHRDSNFYNLGGDSIKGIQLRSLLISQGYNLQIQDVYQYQTVKEIAKRIVFVKNYIDQSEVSGYIKLSPIQNNYFNYLGKHSEYYTQSVLLGCKHRIKDSYLVNVWNEIVKHHDALRILFTRVNDEIIQYNREFTIDNNEIFDVLTYEIEDMEINRAVEFYKNEILSGISVTDGPLIRLAVFRGDSKDHILIMIHRFLIDSTSWNILLEDFYKGYDALIKNKIITYPNKTHSFMTWVDKLYKYDNLKNINESIDYWRSIDDIEVRSIYGDFRGINDQNCKTESITAQLTYEETQQYILNGKNQPIKDFRERLLVALGLVLESKYGMGSYRIWVEDDSRLDNGYDLDISRTVGVISDFYPVLIDFKEETDVQELIESLTMQERNRQNLQYSIYQCINANTVSEGPNNYEVILRLHKPMTEDKGNEMFEFEELQFNDSGTRSIRNQVVLDIDEYIYNDKLTIKVTFATDVISRIDMEEIVSSLKNNIISTFSDSTKIFTERIDEVYGGYKLTEKDLEDLEAILFDEGE